MDDDSIYDACPIRSQLADFSEKLQHTWVNCNICCRLKQKAETQSSASDIKTKPQEKFEATPDESKKTVEKKPLENESSTQHTPTTILMSSSPMDEKPPPPKTTENASSYKAKRNEKPKKDEFLNRNAKDRMDMKRMKQTTEDFDKKEAALKIVETRRTEAQENKSIEKVKTVVASSNMPWVPNPHFMLPPNSISKLSIDDHKRYVAIISNFIRPDRSLRFEYNNIELDEMDAKLRIEREQFVNYVKENFLEKGVYSATFKGASRFVLNKIRERLKTVSDVGYHSIVKEVEWKKDTRSIASRNVYVKKPTILSVGRSKKLVVPDPTRRCVLENDEQILSDRFASDYSNKLLRNDPQAFDYAIEHNVTAILSSSSMRHLLTAPFPLRQYRRAFPLSIFRKFTNGTPQRVVCIGNPLPVSALAKPDLMRVFVKYIVRNSLEKAEKPKEERIFKGVRPFKRRAPKEANENRIQEKKVKIEEEETKNELTDVNAMVKIEKMDEPQSELTIYEEEEESSTEDVKPTIRNETIVKPAVIMTPKSEPRTSLLDLLLDASPVKSTTSQPMKAEIDVFDSIFSKMSEVPLANNAPTTSDPYSYMVVPVDNDGTHKVLVRSRPHGRDIANNPVSITSKLQYIPQCGAEEPFIEERIWNALTATFKDSTYHANVHLTVPDAHCLQFEQIKSQKMFDTLPDESKELLSGRWQRLHNLLNEVKTLDDGEYLLVENDNEMLEIWTESTGCGDAQWTRKKIEEKNYMVKHEWIHNERIEFSSRFNAFSIHTPMVWHVVKGRIPASFLPPNPNNSYSQEHRGGFRGRRGDGRGRGGRGDGKGRGGRGGHNYRGRGNNDRGHGFRGRGRGNNSNRGKPTPYNDLDANPFDLFDE